MKSSEKRHTPYALIPWVCALVALLGCNALGPHALSLRKAKIMGGTSLAQFSAESPTPGNETGPQPLTAPKPSDAINLVDPSSWSLASCHCLVLPALTTRGSAIQGRAPPMIVTA